METVNLIILFISSLLFVYYVFSIVRDIVHYIYHNQKYIIHYKNIINTLVFFSLMLIYFNRTNALILIFFTIVLALLIELIIQKINNSNIFLSLFNIVDRKKEIDVILNKLRNGEKINEKDFFFKTNTVNIINKLLQKPYLKDINKENYKIWSEFQLEKYASKNNIEFSYSLDLKDYDISEHDFSRTNDLEAYFHKKWKFKILKIFNNECFISKRNTELEMDHFLIPKSKGGNFILKHKEGYFLFNVIPLYKLINIEKGDSYGFHYFDENLLEKYFKKIKKINIELNKELLKNE